MEEMHWQIERGDFRAAALARQEFAEFVRLRSWSKEHSLEAKLVFGELVTNAVRHARTRAIVDLLLAEQVHLRVRDDAQTGRFQVRPAPLVATAGRGLYIVQALAEELRFERLCPGLAVYVTLPLQGGLTRGAP